MTPKQMDKCRVKESEGAEETDIMAEKEENRTKIERQILGLSQQRDSESPQNKTPRKHMLLLRSHLFPKWKPGLICRQRIYIYI